MDNQYNYYNPNENSNNEDRQRMNSQSEGSQNGEQKGNTPQWQPGGDHLKKEKKPHKNLMRTVAVVGFAILFGVAVYCFYHKYVGRRSPQLFRRNL